MIGFLVGWAVRSSLLILAGTAMLGASLAIPALTAALPKLPLAVRRAPAHPPATAPATVSRDGARGLGEPAADVGPIPAAAPAVAIRPFDWARLAAIVYALTAGAMLLRLFAGWMVSLRILGRSRGSGLVEDGIEIRESAHVASPVTVGILRPAMLLPPDWRHWDAKKLGAVLAHERSHIRRRDPAVEFLAAIHRALLWVSPASWFLHRSIVRTAEEVSDDDAVTAACDPVTYAEILLEFMQRGVGETNWPRVAMARYDRPEKRIRRILYRTVTPRRITRWGMAAMVMLGAPLAYLAAAAYPQPATPPVHVATPVAPSPAVGAEPPQSPPAQEHTAVPLPQFEVASIKPTDPSVPHPGGAHVYPGGRLEIFAADFKTLVATAFGLSYWQVSGGEAWTGKENYDIEAKPPENLRASIKSLRYSWYEIRDEQLRAMLQALLISRFQLQFHHETKTGDVYLLEQSGKTLRLRPVENHAEDDPTGFAGFESVGYAGGQWDISDTGMPYLAKFASSFIFHAPVLDRTGLTGLYHYRQAVPDTEPKYGGDQSDSFLSFLSEMGLKLERTRGPVEVLVIDHAARPSPN